MSSISPLSDRIVVSRLDQEQLSSGGIVIPDTAKEKPDQGLVVSIGPGKALDNGNTRPVGLSVGNRVIFGKYAGTEVKLDGETFVIMREEDVLGVVSD